MLCKPDVLFFDFDGVLVDSVPLKTKAYQDIFRPHGAEAVRMITEYHLAHGGIDRYKKIRHITEVLDLCSEEQRADFVEHLAIEFAAKVKSRVIEAGGIEAGLRILKRANADGKPCFIVSGTPESELKDIVEARGMSDLFVSIHGSPRSKSEIIQSLIQEHGYNREVCCMIGDAQTDFSAAQAAGVWFFGFPTDAAHMSSAIWEL